MIFWYLSRQALQEQDTEIPPMLQRFMVYAELVNRKGMTHEEAMERLDG